MSIFLNNIKMNVIETSDKGVVNENTIFSFKQKGDNVYAEYSGGQILKGFLVGTIYGNQLKFSYCQKQLDNKLDNGVSTCEISISEKGKIRLIEHFEWKSRSGEKGINVFEEMDN